MKKDDQRTLSLIRVIQVKAPRPERCIAITNLTTRKKNNNNHRQKFGPIKIKPAGQGLPDLFSANMSILTRKRDTVLILSVF